MNLFDFAVRRTTGRIDLHNEVFKEATQPQEAGHRQLPRESCHSLKELAEDKNSHSVKIHRDPQPADNSLEVISDSVFYAFNTQRMANTRMKNANICARINPTFNRSTRW
jgi:hypothetical protein